jgi:hypothetical protein
MQQRTDSKPVPTKAQQSPTKSRPQPAGPTTIDEKALRQVAGGILRIPNGGW